MLHQFQMWKDVQIPREENAEADTLANLGSVADVTNSENAILVHLFHLILNQTKNEVNFTNLTWDWSNEFVNYLQYGGAISLILFDRGKLISKNIRWTFS